MKTHRYLIVAAGLLALLAAPALAYEQGTWILRAGVGTVQPKSHSLTYSDVDGTATIDVEDATSLTLGATYMLTRNWALDVAAALPFEHDIKLTADVGTGPVTAKIAETKQVPPTFSVQYHFSPDGNFQPYAGLGLNWTTFSGTKLLPDFVDTEIGGLRIDDSFGIAAMFGGDWKVGENMVLNFDVRWIDVDADVFLVAPAFASEEKQGTAKVDPWFYALNLGFYF
jgi:outer membrane protein